MKIKKSDLYASLWAGANQLRGSMDASQYKDYVLSLLFVKYVSDKAKSGNNIIEIPEGGSFDNLVAFKNKTDIGDSINKAIRKLADANALHGIIDTADFNDDQKLGKDKEMVDTLTGLVGIFEELNFAQTGSDDDDLLGDAYEYLMKQFATESGKSKGQFYTPAEVSRTMTQILEIPKNTPHNTTAYDPTCGSGSLLLKLVNATSNGLTLYGQEKDNATRALAVMNMYLHSIDDADLRQGNTIASPQFLDNGNLKQFDFVVANPPFSVKNWANGMDGTREYGRFDGYGYPPDKNGDYAFLLHIVKSLKSEARGAVILPHGVLFRGNSEAEIRKNLVRRGLIKAIIGLPSNLFFGTGIPACIIIIDKKGAKDRDGIFMIDASKGFVKDGAKNRLREQDIKKIVDTYLDQLEINKYSRYVPKSEIEDAKNDYNLNIPRYIDTSDLEDIQDLEGHFYGGIPENDLGEFISFWQVFPKLKDKLFFPNREGYVNLATDKAKISEVLDDDEDYRNTRKNIADSFQSFWDDHRETLENINDTTKPAEIISRLNKSLLEVIETLPIIDKYNAYDKLMNYWLVTMQDDTLLVKENGWMEAIKPRAPRIIGKTDKGKDKFEDATLQYGSGKNAKKFVMDVISPEIIIKEYFGIEMQKLETAESELELASGKLIEYIEENTVDDGLLAGCMNGKDEVKEKLAKDRKKELEKDKGADIEEIAAVKKVLALFDTEKTAKKKVKDWAQELNIITLKKFADLSENEIKQLLIDVKWGDEIKAKILGEFDMIITHFINRVAELADRYAETLPSLDARSLELDSKVKTYLEKMGISL